MAESPEIPEAKDPFGRRVAITIAIIAIVLSAFTAVGDNAKTEALVRTTEAANRWAYFQSKSIKEHSYELQKELLQTMAPGTIDEGKRVELVKKYDKKIAKYKEEKTDIGFGRKDEHGHWKEIQDDQGKPLISATQLEGEAKHELAVNDRCDNAVLLLQIAVVLCSVAILVELHAFWYIGMGVALVGAIVGTTALFMPEHHEEHGTAVSAQPHAAKPAQGPGHEAKAAEGKAGDGKAESAVPKGEVPIARPDAH